MSAIAIIPARGGSKRIPRKNLRPLGGVPVISYAINVALKSKLFERVFVTTDDQEIANLSINLGAEVPYLRNADLSDDYATTIDVISDFVVQLQQQGELYEYACCIYPVTPFLQVERLKEAYEIIQTNSWDYVFPAIEFSTPVERGFKKNHFGVIEFKYPEFEATRTQDIEKTFHDSGQFYFGKSEAWFSKKPILTGKSTFIEMLKYESLDIDDIHDWELADKIFSIQSNFPIIKKNS
jgi:pseudaminic acid cytidylyltransferase